jgi:hypothetical protein
MISMAWLKLMNDYRLRRYSGLLIKSYMLTYPPMDQAQVIALEVTILLTLPVVSKLFSRLAVGGQKIIKNMLQYNSYERGYTRSQIKESKMS